MVLATKNCLPSWLLLLLTITTITTRLASVYSFSIPLLHDIIVPRLHDMHSMSTMVTTTIHNHVHANANANANPFVFVDPLTQYKELLKTNPLPTKMMTGATLAVCGDAIAQQQAASSSSDQNQNENNFDYDQRRALSFAVFDMAYRALQHYAFPLIVATCHGQFLGNDALEQTLVSQLGIVPFLYYPVFFTVSGTIQGLSASQMVARAQETFVPLMQRNLLFWIPIQFIQFGYIQEDLQIPFLSCAGLGWTFILSMYAGSAKSYNSNNKDASDSTKTPAVLVPAVTIAQAEGTSSSSSSVEEQQLVLLQENQFESSKDDTKSSATRSETNVGVAVMTE